MRAFASTRDGAVWMGTNGGGLARYRDGTFTRVTRADGLPSDLIRSLYEDADGWLWVGTEGRGLVRLDPRAWDGRAATKPAIVRIGTRDGLFDEVIHQILEDDAGRLWMNTNRGIFWVARAELNAFVERRVARDPLDGVLRARRHAQPRGERRRAARGCQGTGRTALVPDAGRRRRRRSGERSARSAAAAARDRAGGRRRADALRPARDSIALAPDQRDIQIEYTALTFLEPTNVRFRYRLDPYDASWVDVGNRRTAFYTKVPPGRYTFRVEASDAAGGWYEPGTSSPCECFRGSGRPASFAGRCVAAFGMLLFVRGPRARGAASRARGAARARRRRTHCGAARAGARARRAERAAAIARSREDALLRQRVARAAHAAHADDRAAGGSARARRRRPAGRALARHRAPQRAAPAAAGESDPRRREARGRARCTSRRARSISASVHARRGRRVRAGRRAKGHSPDGRDARRAARRVRRRRRREDPDQPPLERHQVHAERRDGARRAHTGWRIGAARRARLRPGHSARSDSRTSSSDSTRWTSRRPARSRVRGSGSRW